MRKERGAGSKMVTGQTERLKDTPPTERFREYSDTKVGDKRERPTKPWPEDSETYATNAGKRHQVIYISLWSQSEMAKQLRLHILRFKFIFLHIWF